ncbi:MAG TPA: hypothetical protein VFR32_11085 [Gaiellaceae bacterium]|nr:hypothetical protein [Gaiellaceae bacterium]
MSRILAIVAAGIALVASGSASSGTAGVGAPRALSPANGAADLAVPALHWTRARGADRYEVGLSADPSFSSPIAASGYTVGSITTRNTFATLTKLPPNGTYWWRVRAVAKSGAVSRWSASRSFRRAWTAAPRSLSPRNGAVITYPKTRLNLSWAPVPYATKYRLALATDPGLGNLYDNKLIEMQATSVVVPQALKAGTYYWAVTPVDAEGNTGARSRVSSFRWAWPSATKPGLTDLISAPEVVDPLFTWRAVPGAVRYEVEISPSQDFAPGSKVCCALPMIGTSFAPTEVLKNNRYYWRVRAIDSDGNVGTWSIGPTFTKTFDTVPPVAGASIRGFHVRDNWGNPTIATGAPILVWDKVPGAAAYEVEVVPRQGVCNWTASAAEHWLNVTATTAWTPLGSTFVNAPFPAKRAISKDIIAKLVPGRTYCARVRALTDQDSLRADVFGDYTYLEPAFTFTGYAAGGGVPGMGPGDYLQPQSGRVERVTPLFTWKSIPGASSYWVLVSKDPSFTNVVDYAFTRIPAYAPREDRKPTTYSDETTSYYWAVLPSPGADGSFAQGNPLSQSPARFEKRSVPPSPVLPAQGKRVSGPPTFRWTPAEGARRYRLQVSAERTFGTLIDEVTTPSTSYTSTKIYPADVALWWRVRAEDENFVGLTWSTPRSFRNLLPAPIPSRSNPTRGDDVPVFTWSLIRGAVSYDLHLEGPDGRSQDFPGLRATAGSWLLWTGTGVFHWKVRATFAQSVGTVTGPYSKLMAFTRTISAPQGARAIRGGGGVLLSWRAKAGARKYRVEIATTPDFAAPERIETSATSYAPLFSAFVFGATSRVRYWRVAAMDSSNNVGNFTQPGRFLGPKA